MIVEVIGNRRQSRGLALTREMSRGMQSTERTTIEAVDREVPTRERRDSGNKRTKSKLELSKTLRTVAAKKLAGTEAECGRGCRSK